MILKLYHQSSIKLKREYELAKAGDKRSTVYQLLRFVRLFLQETRNNGSTGSGLSSDWEELNQIWISEGFQK